MKPYILVSSQNMYSYDYNLKSIYLYRYKTTQQYFLEEKKKQMISRQYAKEDGVSAQQRKLHRTCSVPHTSNCYPWSDY